ncbi:hypothetical protein OG819_55630 [Streptomyces sp. NBC_01549]|uniref:hypothetical protein n=1 Tax=Streptomyces sp. NBC_01549 TaxID=2975874 RepID=UPI0022527656|nr:hypothetical protein [Streptomyces sp. NBC_01549]MCX4598387.1 hypothetical protein [Streptomyces sp. NBC_01549]
MAVAAFTATSRGAMLVLGVTVMPVDSKPRRRRCKYRRCRRLLPKSALPRRRYCGPNCVAGAYRLRKRRERAWNLLTITIDAEAAEFLHTSTGRQERLLAWQTCGGPVCRVVLRAGVRRRRTARYCSARCRQAVYRERKRTPTT